MSANDLHFTWDAHKNAENKRKHGVGFEEACSVFFDERAKLIDDPDHADSEDRFVLLGMSRSLRILLVCHCYRNDDEEIRIISARKAVKRETSQYAQRTGKP
jgi:uncharacterized protein